VEMPRRRQVFPQCPLDEILCLQGAECNQAQVGLIWAVNILPWRIGDPTLFGNRVVLVWESGTGKGMVGSVYPLGWGEKETEMRYQSRRR
jgi:hypothetical protein